MSLWDDSSYDLLSARHVALGRQMGLLAILPTALTSRIVALTFLGDFGGAEHLIAEQRVLTSAMGIPMPPYGPLLVAAWRGGPNASAVIDAAISETITRGEGGGLALADYATAVLNIGLGRYDAARRAAAATDAFDEEGFTIYTQGLAELVECDARLGSHERAQDNLGRLSEMAYAAGSEWAAGIRVRSQALLAADDVAETMYREAIERLATTRIQPQIARTHLLYGEWLRRQRRRIDAREELRIAHGMFETMGMNAFRNRTTHELQASGESPRTRVTESRSVYLAPHEAHVARLALDGLSNPEIGARLFISAHTVQYHLRKVYAKAGINSRSQLDRVLPLIEAASEH